MTVRTFWRLLHQGKLPVLLGIGRVQRPYYRLCFLSAALRNGLLARLAQGPVSFEQLAAEYAPDHAHHDACARGLISACGLESCASNAAVTRCVAGWRAAWRIPRTTQSQPSSIEAGDVRARPSEPSFDVATLHNNIYYFPVAERPALLAHVRGFLRPGGRLLVTTGCQGGRPEVDILNVWAAMTAGCGRLPTADELERQLVEAGYVNVHSRRLVPGASYYGFVAETAR